MRLLALIPMFFTGVCLAQAPAPAAVQEVFPAAGINVLCEQAEPLLRRGLPPEAAGKIDQHFSSANLCAELASRISPSLTQAQLDEVKVIFQDPLAKFFNQAEVAVGTGDVEAFNTYRQQLAERPPRGARVDLIRRLDAAAHTSELAHALRYEVGKTQAWLVLHGRGDPITETILHDNTQTESQAIRDSSVQGVEAFMLYAYRQIPSDKLQSYVDLYEQPSMAALLDELVVQIPQVFAERRAQLR